MSAALDRTDETVVGIYRSVVRAEAPHVVAFAEALGLAPTATPPLTFPIRWLGAAEIRSLIESVPGVAEGGLMHQSQSFDYARPLETDRGYTLDAEVRWPSSGSDRIALRAVLREGDSERVMSSETLLRILHRKTLSPPTGRWARQRDTLGTDYWTGPITLTQTKRYTAAALDTNPLHRDAGAARALGLARPIVPGMMLMGQFEPAVRAWRPALRIKRLHATFLQPLPIGGRVALRIRLAAAIGDRDNEHLILRLMARDEEGDPVAVGEIEARAAIGDRRLD